LRQRGSLHENRRAPAGLTLTTDTSALTACPGARAIRPVDLLIAGPSNTTAWIQEMHSLLRHLLCIEIEARRPERAIL
jgi:phosphoheptose isomerase